MKLLRKTTAVWLTLNLVLSATPGAEAKNVSETKPTDERPAMIYKPTIYYPTEARRARISGRGIVVLAVDSETGKVTDVWMEKSTGHAVLDRETIRAFREARFSKGTYSRIRIPIAFSLWGGGSQPFYAYDVKSKNMDEVLARFLGKGTVLKGPIPEYPQFPAWTSKSGKGVYELHADKDGKVDAVKILKSSGDATFDRVAVKTLGKWRLRRGPLALELPLSFTLTPTNYSVDVAR